MGRRKGIFGEELPATLLTVILLFIFIAASISMYTGFFQRMGLVERERAASSMTEFVFFSGMQDADSIIAMFDNKTGTRVVVTDLETSKVSSIGSIENASSASVSSVPLLLYDPAEGRMHLGRMDAHVSG
jgi:hypothetical protein